MVAVLDAPQHWGVLLCFVADVEQQRRNRVHQTWARVAVVLLNEASGPPGEGPAEMNESVVMF